MEYEGFCPVDVRFTDDIKETLHECMEGHRSVFIVAGSGTRKRAKLDEIAESTGVKCVFSPDITPNPTIHDIYNCLCAVQWEATDLIIAVGGGSAMDVAKGVSAVKKMIRGELSYEKTAAIVREGKYADNSDTIDIVAVPTTSGTGSDVTKWATIWDVDTKNKLSMESNWLYPKMSVICPALTVTMSPLQTLSTGLDALSHAMEAFWAKAATPLVKETALLAIDKIRVYLKRAVDDGANMDARAGMMMGALLAGMAFSCTRTTACHSISYPMTMDFGVIHGFAVAVTLTPVADMNEEVAPDISRIWDVFGGREMFGSWLEGVCAGVQDLKLRDLGVPKEALRDLADRSITPGRMDNNPAALTADDVFEMLNKLY